MDAGQSSKAAYITYSTVEAAKMIQTHVLHMNKSGVPIYPVRHTSCRICGKAKTCQLHPASATQCANTLTAYFGRTGWSSIARVAPCTLKAARQMLEQHSAILPDAPDQEVDMCTDYSTLPIRSDMDYAGAGETTEDAGGLPEHLLEELAGKLDTGEDAHDLEEGAFADAMPVDRVHGMGTDIFAGPQQTQPVHISAELASESSCPELTEAAAATEEAEEELGAQATISLQLPGGMLLHGVGVSVDACYSSAVWPLLARAADRAGASPLPPNHKRTLQNRKVCSHTLWETASCCAGKPVSSGFHEDLLHCGEMFASEQQAKQALCMIRMRLAQERAMQHACTQLEIVRQTRSSDGAILVSPAYRPRYHM